GASAALKIFEFEGVGMIFFEGNCGHFGGRGVRAPVLDDKFAVEPEAIAVVSGDAKLEGAGLRRGEDAGPTHGEVFPAESGSGTLAVEVEVHVGVDAGDNRLALKIAAAK